MVLPLIAEALETALGGAEGAGAVLEGVDPGTLAKAVPKPLSSQALATAAWSNGTTLTIVMRDGTVCTYTGVPEDVYDDLVGAVSPGTYYNLSIRGQY